MELVKLDKKDQLTIPKSILRSIDVSDESPVLVETTNDGAIILRPAAVYPFEVYSDQRIAEFEGENTAPAATVGKARKLLAKKS